MTHLPPSVDRLVGRLVALDPGGLVAVYLHGSAVSGGLRPDSDVDLLAVTTRTLTRPERRAVLDALLGVSGRRATEGPGRPLELTAVVLGEVRPWRYPPRCDFLYGEWLRDEYADGALPLPHPHPDLAVTLTDVRQRGHALHGPDPEALLDPVPVADLRRAVADGLDPLLDDLVGDERNVLLTLARMLVTLESGEIAPKDVAARRVAPGLPPAEAAVLRRAADAYTGAAEDDWSRDRAAARSTAALLATRVRDLSPEGADRA